MFILGKKVTLNYFRFIDFEFLKIYFPMNVLSDEDFKELMKNLLISQNSLIIEEN